MDWSGAGAFLVTARAIHFAATTTTAGTLVFRIAIARSVLRSEEATAKGFRLQTQRVLWAGLAAAVISGAVWLVLEAVSMSGLPFNEAMSAEILSTVLHETQFGQITEVRAGFAVVLAACLIYSRLAAADWLAVAAALGLVATLAWTGHASSTLGPGGSLHLASDALHLVAAAAWIGGLASLILLFAAVRRTDAWAALTLDAARRFSILGIVSVVALVATGAINAWILAGSLHALIVTDYGRVLMLKLAVFVMMLALAAVNRFHLTPRLAIGCSEAAQSESVGHLTRNGAIETVLGLAILAIVALLGTMHPAIHLVSH
jgi:putative copper resistance protein D